MTKTKSLKTLSLALAVAALTGTMTTAFAATNTAGTGNGVAFGEGSRATTKDTEYSIAIGENASAVYENAIAIGNGANSTHKGVAIGENAASTGGDSAIAIGTNSIAEHANNIAISQNARAMGGKSIAIGHDSYTNGSESIALGGSSSAGTKQAIALGNESVVGASATAGVAIGYKAKVSARYGLAMGNEAIAKGELSVAIGSNANTSAERALAVGYGANAAGKSSLAFGEAANSKGTNSLAFGLSANAVSDNSVALGANTVANVAHTKAEEAYLSKEAYTSKEAGVVSVGNAKDNLYRRITNVAGGAADHDAVNVAQLKAVTLNVTGDESTEGSVKLSEQALSITGEDGITTKAENNSVKLSVDKDKLTETLSDKFAKLDASNLTDNNIEEWKNTLGVTSEQLSQAGAWTIQGGGADKATISGAKKVNFVGGSFTKVDVTSTGDGAKVSIGLDETATKAIEKVNTVIKTDENGNAKLNIVGDAETGVKVEAQADGSTKVSLEEQAKVGQVAINGKDGKGEITGLTNTTWTPDKPETIKADRAATEGQLQTIVNTINSNIESNTKEIITEQATIGGNTTINEGGITITSPETGNTTVINGDSVTTTTVNAETVNAGTVSTDKVVVGDKTYITKDGIDANNQTIKNVAPGVNGTDAVNLDQLNQATSTLNSSISHLETNVKKVAAGSAALAALHPLDFDSDDKLTFAVGFGAYKGEQAAAIGAFYRPNDNLMFSIGTALGNSDNQYNAGLSFKFGDSSPYTNMSKADMVNKLETQEKNMATLQADNAELKARLAKLEALVAGN